MTWVLRNMMAVVTAAALVTVSADAEETNDYLHYRLGVKYKTEKQYEKAIEEFRKVLAEYPDNYNVYMHIAEIRIAQSQSRLAIANLKQALAYNPGWSKALKMLADSYVKDGQLQKAIIEYQHFQQVCDPSERDSIQRVIDRLVENIGVSGMLSGSNPAASTSVIRAQGTASVDQEGMSGPPKNPKAAAAFRRVLTYHEQQQYDSVLVAIREVIALEPDFLGSYYYGGIARFHLGDFGKAAINFSRARDYREPSYEAALCLGKMYGKEKRYARAVAELTRYIQRSNSDVGKKEARVLLAAYQRLAAASESKQPASSTASEGAVENQPREKETEKPVLEVRIDTLLSMVSVDTLSDPGQRLLAGIREFQAGNYDNAIREFKKTLAEFPTGSVAVHCLYNCGVCYCKLRLFKEAENQFQQILERYGSHELAAQALFLKAITYMERKDISSAEAALRQFLQKYRTHAWQGKAWEKLGDIFAELEQPKKAIDAYLQAHAVSTSCVDQVSALFKAGGMYVMVGNLSRAYAAYDSVISRGERCKVSGRVPDAYYRIADEKYKAKEYDAALDYYQRAVRKYPEFQETPWGMFQIGTIHKNLKRYREAIAMYKDLMTRYPDDYWAKQAQWKYDDAVWEHEYQATLR